MLFKLNTCRLTGNFKALFYRLKCNYKINVSHRLKDAQQSIYADESPRGGKRLQKFWVPIEHPTLLVFHPIVLLPHCHSRMIFKK